MNYNRYNPCPICGSTDYCAYIKSQNGYLTTCHKLKKVVSKNEIIDGIDGKEYVFLYEKNGCYMFEDKEQYDRAKKAYREGFKYKVEDSVDFKKKTENKAILEDKGFYDELSVSHEHLNIVYRTVLKYCTLSNKHINMLKNEKWPDWLIKSSDYYTTPAYVDKNKIIEELIKNNVSVEGVPGFFVKNGSWTFNMVNGMILPVYDINKNIIRLQIRPDWAKLQLKQFSERGEKPPKYLSFSSKGKYYGSSSGAVAGIHHKSSSFKTVIVTEGSKDARIASEYLNRPCVYLPGVDTYEGFLNSRLFDDLKK